MPKSELIPELEQKTDINDNKADLFVKEGM